MLASFKGVKVHKREGEDELLVSTLADFPRTWNFKVPGITKVNKEFSKVRDRHLVRTTI